ncbi:MAG: ABC transporter permease [Deltaproteobacteria bacterium]|nr:ABC transporter permease [Deltaproteobacteria bacterium]
MSPLVRMAFRNVRRNWRHSLATLSSIAAGFLALGVFEGYVTDLRERFGDSIRHKSMMGDFIIEKRGSAERAADDIWAYTLDEREQAGIDAILSAESQELKATVRFLDIGGMATNGKTSSVFAGFGYDIAQGQIMRAPDFVDNVIAGQIHSPRATTSVVLASGLARSLDCAFEGPAGEKSRYPEVKCKRPLLQLSTTTETGQLNAVEPEVRGVEQLEIKEYDLRFLSVPLPLAQRLADTTRVSRYSIELHPAADRSSFHRRFVERARMENLDVEITEWVYHRYAELFRRGIELLQMFRNFVVIVVVVVAGMSVFNTMAKTVSERTREIGSLRALGFLRRQVVRLFVLEGSMLASLGILMGLVATLALVSVVNALGVPYDAGMMSEPIPLTIAYAVPVYVQATLFLVLVAVLAAYLPARRAARMSVPDALGHA